MVIDCHAHYPRAHTDFPERLVEQLPQVGIDQICLFSAGDTFGHAPNDMVMAAARRFPKQIIPFALVELGKHTPDDVDRFAREGFRGFKITNPRSSYDDPAYFPLYERMEAAGLPLLAHTGILMRLPPERGVIVNSNWMRPICLDAMLRSFPRLNVIGAHLGMPWHDEASALARIHPNFYVDLTGANWGGWRLGKGPEFFHRHFFWPNAWDKVLFGTDILSLDELVPAKTFHDRMIDQLDLPPPVRRKIYGETAARLLGL